MGVDGNVGIGTFFFFSEIYFYFFLKKMFFQNKILALGAPLGVSKSRTCVRGWTKEPRNGKRRPGFTRRCRYMDSTPHVLFLLTHCLFNVSLVGHCATVPLLMFHRFTVSPCHRVTVVGFSTGDKRDPGVDERSLGDGRRNSGGVGKGTGTYI